MGATTNQRDYSLAKFGTEEAFFDEMSKSLMDMGINSIFATSDASIITGVEGAMLSPFFAKLFRITDPVAEGVAIGACSHAIGTSKALEIGQLQGAMSSISICICGIMTSLLVLLL